jgi:hypothetical protein
MDEYVPGTCNIGVKETGKRKAFGIGMLALSVLAWLALAHFAAPRALRLLLFFPLFAGFVGVFQARAHFCVSNAYARKFVME